MNCDRCGKPSVYHSTLIVNGVSQTTNLCRDCAIKEGVFENSHDSLFDDMFDFFTDFLPLEYEPDIVCPVCKTTLRDFNSTHKLGCPNCYEVFREQISSMLKRIAPKTQHKPDTNQPDKKGKSNDKALTKQEKIANLRQEMAIAVKEERYEDAGKLKKQIQKLEAQND